MEIKPEYEQRLADMSGRLPNGKPKMRILLPTEAVRPHGKWKGEPKYIDPESGARMECLVLEQWYPPELLPIKELWPTELMGPYPTECGESCCNGGFWGLRMPLMYPDGQFLPLTEGLIRSIEQKHFFDVTWSGLSEIERQRQLDASLSARNQKADADALRNSNEVLEYYATNKKEMDNADNRVWSWGDKLATNGKNSKMPVGKPNI